ncbi:hypothetical protein MTO96_037780 [Rhipicephalus appendiculatus]
MNMQAAYLPESFAAPQKSLILVAGGNHYRYEEDNPRQRWSDRDMSTGGTHVRENTNLASAAKHCRKWPPSPGKSSAARPRMKICGIGANRAPTVDVRE